MPRWEITFCKIRLPIHLWDSKIQIATLMPRPGPSTSCGRWCALTSMLLYSLRVAPPEKRNMYFWTFPKCGKELKLYHSWRPSLIRGVVIRLPFKGGECKGGGVDTSLGHLQHYREYCVGEISKICKEAYWTHIERDTTLWNWREAVTKMLKKKRLI